MRFDGYKKERNARKKWVVVYTTCSCDPIVYGTFKSEHDANKYIDYFHEHKWGDYERNNEAHLQVEYISEVSDAYKK